MAFDGQNRQTGTSEQLLFLELNEVNFEHIVHYVEQGRLPAFASFFERHGFETTTSEAEYQHLEPWIQWVTAHTGLSFADHGVFRLGDIRDHDLPQIWEVLEAHGYRSGAISPMNANCRMKDPAFFVPDPWTGGRVVAPSVLKRLYASISDAVNENASARVGVRALIDLAVGAAFYARTKNWARYGSLVAGARSGSWRRALFLDLLLADVFVRSVKQTRPQFATLFLNAAAHIQHHYMYSSDAYTGSFRNPSWYIGETKDPLFEVYSLYDRILSDVQKSFPQARIMIATGLHQEPHDAVTFYWRLKAHEEFLGDIGVRFERVEPRMSRDFLVICGDEADALAAQRLLEATRASDGGELFEVDNRGRDLFVMLTWPHDIPPDLRIVRGSDDFGPLKPHVAFVAIKNGRHDGVGYFADSHASAQAVRHSFPLTEIPKRIMAAFSQAWPVSEDARTSR